ncbi:MAG: Nif3-like dinuclear metal center hexameric protein, partial [Candidatus Marinamargulisbacteria bacterium]
DLLTIMHQWAPEDRAESWDNVGLQLDTHRDISRIAVVLELNLDTWDILSQHNYDMIISHHPLLFTPLKTIGHTDWTHNVIRELIRRDTGLYVSHTNLDRAPDGVSDHLLRQYSLDILSTTDLRDGYGKVVHMASPIDITDIEHCVPVIAKIVPDNLSIQSIAFLGGSGKSFVNDIVNHPIDFYITGELGYHEIQYLRQQKKGLFLLGHYQSEVFILDEIQRRLSHLDIEIDIIK